ncbi:MAG: thiamine biosynthesis protein ThiS [Spirochaetes bacterium RBG_13_51_14]|nr:MAG: thiamine biosynthesis protein ThiS [Spirochaetes bacterium RBG_13_51_14]
MIAIVNGEMEEIDGNPSILELLAIKNVERPDMVSVELNGVILKRNEFGSVKLNENDAIEFLYFMGGGFN